MFSSLATPNILIEDPYSVAFTWSLRLSLPVSSLFFAASAVNWPASFERWLIRFRRVFWLMGFLLLLTFGFVVFGLPDLSSPFAEYDLLINVLGGISHCPVLWTARRALCSTGMEKR
ncbi:MAG: hypothetical protein IPJ90_07515 [Anaerolineaceae bacterium]|nr:hypothetical protein [Anaerolineaceae bacterium]